MCVNRWADWLRDNGPGRFQLASKCGWDTFVNTAPRADLDVLTRAEMAGSSAEELEDYTEARLVWNANLRTCARLFAPRGRREEITVVRP